MNDLKLEVICENGKVEYFKEGIVGSYFWIGHPTELEEEPEYIIRVFFDKDKKFRGILLVDDYKEELKDSFESLICCEIPRDIKEYEIFSSLKIKNGEIVSEKYDLCECNICGYLTDWNECDIWECEECQETVCTNCIEEYNPEAKEIGGVGQLDKILCKKCFDIDKITNRINDINQELASTDINKFCDTDNIEAFNAEKEILEQELARLKNL